MSKIYTTSQGDTFDIIAKLQLGDEHYMSLLIEVNYPYRDIVIFPAGIALNLPDIPTTAEQSLPENLPPWRRQQTLQS